MALAEKFQLALTEVLKLRRSIIISMFLKTEERSPEIAIRVCNSITCEMSGAKELISELRNNLGDDVRYSPHHQRVHATGPRLLPSAKTRSYMPRPTLYKVRLRKRSEGCYSQPHRLRHTSWRVVIRRLNAASQMS